ncbi:MAG: crossover junction endodeoxyribonuclease RuvC [Firmicutes bacterium]|nr:crossover junction endodeoxyribonuclease RuvC [Bacillota bacterium]MBR7148349.1 crossover junction endodeoxyribonuclease RuvC [Bacillota bacterium]
MRIIGIDPGYAILGYGVVEVKGNRFFPVEYGAVTTDKDMEMPDRLKHLYSELMEIIDRTRPDVCSIEELFFNTNTTTAILVGQARGVAILACANSGVPINEYTPVQIKQALTGYGRAEKKQVQMMVKAMLGLDEVPKPDDTADALAAAICHGHAAPGKERMKKYEEALQQKHAQQIKNAQSTKNRWEQLIEDYEKGVKR